jgi:hypothetical protein
LVFTEVVGPKLRRTEEILLRMDNIDYPPVSEDPVENGMVMNGSKSTLLAM